MSRPLAPCGTRSAYQRHRRNHEPIDAPCRRAATDWTRDRRHSRGDHKRRNRRHVGGERVHIFLTAETAELLREMADNAGTGVSELVERMVILVLVQHAPPLPPDVVGMEDLYQDAIREDAGATT